MVGDDQIPSTPFAHREGGGVEFAAALMEMDDEMGNNCNMNAHFVLNFLLHVQR